MRMEQRSASASSAALSSCCADSTALTAASASPVPNAAAVAAPSSDMSAQHGTTVSVSVSAAANAPVSLNSAFKHLQDAHSSAINAKHAPIGTDANGKPLNVYSAAKVIAGTFSASGLPIGAYGTLGRLDSPNGILPAPYQHGFIASHPSVHSFAMNSDVLANGSVAVRRMNPSVAFPPPQSIPLMNVRRGSSNNQPSPSTPTNVNNLTPSSSSASVPASATSLSPHLSPASGSVSSSSSVSSVVTAMRAASPGIPLDSDSEFHASPSTSSALTTSHSLRNNVAVPNGSSTPPRAFSRPGPLLYSHPAGMPVHPPPYYPHEAFYPAAAYYPHPPPHALPQGQAEYDYSTHALRLPPSASAQPAVPPAAVGSVYPPDMLAYPYPYPAMYPPPIAGAGYPLYYPYPHPASAAQFYEQSALAGGPLGKMAPGATAHASREEKSSTASAAFGSTDEINQTLSSTPSMHSSNGGGAASKLTNGGPAGNAAGRTAGMKRRKRPVSSLEEMLYRLSEFSVMEKRLKSKNKACATLGYSKGTINSYIDKVHAALESGVELAMMGPLTAFDIRRMIHKRSEGKKEQQEKLVHHQQRKKQKNEHDAQAKAMEVSSATTVTNSEDDENSNDNDGEDDDDVAVMQQDPQRNASQANPATGKELSIAAGATVPSASSSTCFTPSPRPTADAALAAASMPLCTLPEPDSAALSSSAPQSMSSAPAIEA